ncbi:hypothetical protein [Halomonas halocynthiae]|uniref:hypothetical protein n=1 Tax=Halomonas halocynthiae TaxID=176290 RepID=UPI000484E9F8|nr:hypothetical protein [Halomonas halocynthiae]
MPQNGFYAKVRRGLPAILSRWLEQGRGDADQLALILAETARVAGLGHPEFTPDGATLTRWSQGSEDVPLWAAKTAVFLLIQMPARPQPDNNDEACGWAYCWLRNRHHANLHEALQALPEHLRQQPTLRAAMADAWQDHQGLRLI